MTAKRKHDFENAAEIVRDAGGRIVGRTKLQKIGCLFELAGVGSGFEYTYRHFGPYSERLATASRDADVLGLVAENEYPTSWGGWYSTFTTKLEPDESIPSERIEIAKAAVSADSIVLELAVTAAFLASQGVTDAWAETKRRKPEKAADGRLRRAKALYRKFKQIRTPKSLPNI